MQQNRKPSRARRRKKSVRHRILFIFEKLLCVALLAAIAAGCVWYANETGKGKTPVTSAPVSTEKPMPTESAEPTPFVDQRAYEISLPDAPNEGLGAQQEELIEAVRAEFEKACDGTEPAVLTVEGSGTESENYYSLILHVSYPGCEEERYVTFSKITGTAVSLEEIWGEEIRSNVALYFAEQIAKDNAYAELLSEDFAENTAENSPYLDCFAVSEDGKLVFFFPGSTVLNEPETAAFVMPDSVPAGTFRPRIIDRTKRMVAITIDDGPHEVYTNEMLDILEEYGAVVTFFDIGTNVDKYPEATARAAAMGCEIGSHTYWHTAFTSTYDNIVADKKRADEAFMNALGYVPALVRPPEGKVSYEGMNTTDQIFVGWSVDTLDWLYKDRNYEISVVKDFGNLDGQVILLHAIYKESVEALRVIVPWLLEKDYQLVTVSEMFEYGYNLEPKTCYYYAYDFFIKGRPAEEAELAP